MFPLLLYFDLTWCSSSLISLPSSVITMSILIGSLIDDIVLISPGEGYSVMNFEGQISGYGSVFVKFKVASINTSKTSGTLDGQGRTILEDGTLISTPLKGTWKRNGKSMKFYFTDAINNGAMNFVMWDVDVLGKTADVKYFELHSSDN